MNETKTYINFSHNDRGDVKFTSDALLRDDSRDISIKAGAKQGTRQPIVLVYPDGSSSDVFPIADVVIEHTPMPTLERGWNRQGFELNSRPTAVTYSIGVSEQLMSTITNAIPAPSRNYDVCRPVREKIADGFSWMPAGAGKDLGFTIVLEEGKIERMPSLETFLHKVKSSLVCDVGLMFSLEYDSNDDPSAYVQLVNVHVKDMTAKSSPRHVLRTDSVATSSRVNPLFVHRLKELGALGTHNGRMANQATVKRSDSDVYSSDSDSDIESNSNSDSDGDSE